MVVVLKNRLTGGAYGNERSLGAVMAVQRVRVDGQVMNGKILNSDGQFVAYIKADVIYDLAGRRLYALRGEKIYKPTGELIGHLNFIKNGAGWLSKASERLFSTE